jgi:hypothetical protein
MSLDWSLVVPLAQVIGTVGGLLLVWWKVTQIREVNAYELLRDEVKRFHTPEMRACRARLARTLLSSRRAFVKIEESGEEVCGYFEDIGLLLRRRVVPVYFIWSMLSDYILLYAHVLRDYVAWIRQSTKDQTLYMEFDLLRDRIAALQKKRSGLEPAFTDDELREFLEDEAKLIDETAIPRRPGRRLGVVCPHCRNPLGIRPADVGKTLRCPTCKGTFTLQQPSTGLPSE